MMNMPKEINKVFWGLLLVLLDFNLNQFDILPDFIGFFIIISALNNLVQFSRFFATSRVLAAILGIISIPAMFIAPFNLYTDEPQNILLSLTTSTILGLIHLIFMYFLLQGFIELAMKSELPQLVAKTKNYLAIYVIAMLTIHIATPFIFNLSDSMTIMVITASAIISIIIQIMILILLRSFRASFSNKKNEHR